MPQPTAVPKCGVDVDVPRAGESDECRTNGQCGEWMLHNVSSLEVIHVHAIDAEQVEHVLVNKAGGALPFDRFGTLHPSSRIRHQTEVTAGHVAEDVDKVFLSEDILFGLAGKIGNAHWCAATGTTRPWCI